MSASRPELVKEHITDDSARAIWAAEEPDRKAWVALDLKEEHVVTVAMLSDAPYHRTQAFTLEAKVNGQWKPLAAGTAIGDRCNLTFDPVTARVFRLTLDKTSDTPTLADFQLLGEL